MHLQSLSCKERHSRSTLPNDKIKFYTGFVSRNVLDTVWSWIKPAVKTITLYSKQKKSSQDTSSDVSSPPCMRRLDSIDEFLLTLVRLRLGAPQEDLAYRFEVSQSRVSKILANWLSFLAAQFKGIISWPTSTVGSCHSIFSNFPNTVAAMDCVEVSTERPYNLQSQKAM